LALVKITQSYRAVRPRASSRSRKSEGSISMAGASTTVAPRRRRASESGRDWRRGRVTMMTRPESGRPPSSGCSCLPNDLRRSGEASTPRAQARPSAPGEIALDLPAKMAASVDGADVTSGERSCPSRASA
jgi:hypothetical protein